MATVVYCGVFVNTAGAVQEKAQSTAPKLALLATRRLPMATSSWSLPQVLLVALQRRHRQLVSKIPPRIWGPPSYLGTADESNIQTHVNPVLFKQDWDTELSTKVPVVQSRLEGAKYKYKHEVRRLLMDRAVQKEVAVHVPLISGVFCQSEREPESD